MMQKTQFYAGGCWHDASGNNEHQVTNPYTEQPVATVAECSPDDVGHAVRAARAAFDSWSRTPLRERIDLLKRIAEGLKNRQAEFAQTITTELGMPLKLSQRIQVGSPIATFELAANEAERYAWEERVGHSLILKEAAGVVAAITPWNYPLHQIAAKLAPALVTGCTVVLKPSEITPLNALLLAEVIDAAGAPPGVFNLVLGSGVTVGEILASHPEVDLISFTGSTRAGRRIMALASDQIKRVRLELGGKSAAVVLPGADLAKAVKSTVNACMLNSGQTCSALTRLVVSAADYDEAAELAVQQARSFILGDPFSDRTKLGPLVSRVQRDRVRGFIEKGLSEGASLLAGGMTNGDVPVTGFFVAPTILGDVLPQSTVAQEEIFGPVLSILRYRDIDDAVAITNGSLYGLSGAVWGPDVDHALSFARRVRTGQMDINGAPFNMLAPFGGFKQSGFGRELGRFGLDEFVEMKSVQLPDA
jgi:acyl-CoA reductase-like NAD-dependent aldehyde dehydrogenase